jgi:hypothetical protein
MCDSRVQDHYAKAGPGDRIAARILAAFRATEGDVAPVTPETLAPFDHYHGGCHAKQIRKRGNANRWIPRAGWRALFANVDQFFASNRAGTNSRSGDRGQERNSSINVKANLEMGLSIIPVPNTHPMVTS